VPQSKIIKPDIFFIQLSLALVGIGILFIISASWHESLRYFDTPWNFINKHLLFVILGVSSAYLFSIVHIQWLKKFAWLFAILVLIGLILTAKFGIISGGSRRWLSLGPINLQISEFAKIVVTLITAKVLSEKKSYWFAALLILPIIGLVLKQPDLGTTILIASGAIAAIFASGFNLALFFMGLISFISAGVYVVMHTPYQMNRIRYWLNPYLDPKGHGYNLIQSTKAIASGGIFGQGIGESVQKLGPLPISYADFIFSIICEETGFFGALVILIVFFAWIFRALYISFCSEDKFIQIFGFSLTIVFAMQVIINIAVASGLFPITGMTLPFVSFGGSSFIANSIIAGIILNISRINSKYV
jgi:cell division protein FtsW